MEFRKEALSSSSWEMAHLENISVQRRFHPLLPPDTALPSPRPAISPESGGRQGKMLHSKPSLSSGARPAHSLAPRSPGSAENASGHCAAPFPIHSPSKDLGGALLTANRPHLKLFPLSSSRITGPTNASSEGQPLAFERSWPLLLPMLCGGLRLLPCEERHFGLKDNSFPLQPLTVTGVPSGCCFPAAQQPQWPEEPSSFARWEWGLGGDVCALYR
nr:uncharacterized protein LOC118970449 [Manis javanica]